MGRKAGEPNGEAVNGVAPSRIITREELRKHATPGDCWLLIHGAVYDVTSWCAMRGETKPGSANPGRQRRLPPPPFLFAIIDLYPSPLTTFQRIVALSPPLSTSPQ